MKIPTLASSIEVLIIISWLLGPTLKQSPILLKKLGIKSQIIISNPNDFSRWNYFHDSFLEVNLTVQQLGRPQNKNVEGETHACLL